MHDVAEADPVGEYDTPFSPQYDELHTASGEIREHWSELAGVLEGRSPAVLERYRRRVRTLVDNHGITYNPVDSVGADGEPTGPVRWEVDALPLVLAADDWAVLERGLVQRSRVLDALLADLYGPQRTLTTGLLPPELVFGHPGYLRAAHGVTLPGPHQLFIHAVDVARHRDGSFRAIRDHTQAPSGLGYAMADRRVVAHAMPEIYTTAGPRPLAPFGHALRLALRDVAPSGVEDPFVVVLSPGAQSETAFDQAHLASVLGVPLVESADLTVREGRLWMRSLGSLTRVDVVMRRIDADYADPLDLRRDSRLGVVGLVEVVRRGGVSLVNPLGSGVLENPALAGYLRPLARALLDEELLLESEETHWGGTASGLSELTSRLPDLVLRSTVTAETVVGETLTVAEREELLARVKAQPGKWVAQERVEYSHAPSLDGTAVTASPVSLRLFTVAQRVGYTPMPGGLCEVLVPGAAPETEPRVAAKDVWVRTVAGGATTDAAGSAAPESLPRFAAPSTEVVASPRVLNDMFWIGRYSERAEDTARLLISMRERYQDYRNRPWLEGSECLPVLLGTLVSTSQLSEGVSMVDDHRNVAAEFRALTVDRARPGSLAQSFGGLERAARAVRDQLSHDTWTVLADVQRALDDLAVDPEDDGAQLGATQSAVLNGMLALSGLGAESMVRDLGWHVMDIGKRLERGLALVSLLSSTLTREHTRPTERALMESVLAAAESSVTFRRRNTTVRVAAVAQLLLFDPGNPRSLAYLLDRLRENLVALPHSSGSSLPERLVDELLATLRRCDPSDLETVTDGVRVEFARLLDSTHAGLTELAVVLMKGPLSLPGGTRPLWGGTERRDLP